MTKLTQERAFETILCRTFVGLSVATATLGFWSKGWLPGALLTVAMAVVVFLLSRAVERVMEAWTSGNRFTAIAAAVLAFGFALTESNLNHVGLAHLNADYGVIPAGAIDLGFASLDYVWGVCLFVSAVNVFAEFAFARRLEVKEKQAPALSPGSVLANRRWQKQAA